MNELYKWVRASDELPKLKGYYITRRPTLNDNEWVVKEELFNPKYDDISERWISLNYEWQQPITPDEQDELWKELYSDLDDMARDRDSYDYGLPMYDNKNFFEYLKKNYTIIKNKP